MQYRLSASGMLAAWEAGYARRPLDRALTLLWAAGAAGNGDPADLPLAERDRRLLSIRAGTFGRSLSARATCPHCGAELEMELDASVLAEALPAPADDQAPRRPITSRDLAAVAELPEAEMLAGLCQRLAAEDFSDTDAEALGRWIEAQAAAAELSTRITCSECGAGWIEVMDVASYLWAEVENAALALLGEVAELAAAYGWSEQDILSLGTARRAAYLVRARQA
jgi:hypothetical protein